MRGGDRHRPRPSPSIAVASPRWPVRQQSLDVKRRYPKAIVFFRLGDFYETFDDDAQTVARELEIVLTSRNVAKGMRVPMAGIPHHAAESYLAKLIARGYHVAICEQVGETPARRGGGARGGGGGRRGGGGAPPQAEGFLRHELARLGPREVLLPEGMTLEEEWDGHVSTLPEWKFEPGRAETELCEHFHTPTLEGFGLAGQPRAGARAGATPPYSGAAAPAG